MRAARGIRLAGALALSAVALAVSPAVALGASLLVDAGCHAEQSQLGVTGDGFTPGGAVRLQWDDGSAGPPLAADGAGRLSGVVAAPAMRETDPDHRTATLTATDMRDAARTGTASVLVSRFTVRTVPARARPHARVTYEVRGFVGAEVLYAHYVHRGRLRRTIRLGRPVGPCGDLDRRQSLLPVRRARRGTWRLQVDAVRRYSGSTRPRWRGELKITTAGRRPGLAARLR